MASRVGPAQARVAAMLLLTLRGTPTMYYGDEIGLARIHIPRARVQDPWEKNEPGLGFGRDPERTPMQWDTSRYAGFSEAAATLGAQTGLSTFVSLASILLILFLEPPSRVFASWTAPRPDKRPVLLVVVLIVALLTVLFTPALSGYFGLTGPAQPIYTAVVPTLAVWFLALSAAYRVRLLDRVLGLGNLPKSG